jgi:hypothetical protein
MTQSHLEGLGYRFADSEWRTDARDKTRKRQAGSRLHPSYVA